MRRDEGSFVCPLRSLKASAACMHLTKDVSSVVVGEVHQPVALLRRCIRNLIAYAFGAFGPMASASCMAAQTLVFGVRLAMGVWCRAPTL